MKQEVKGIPHGQKTARDPDFESSPTSAVEEEEEWVDANNDAHKGKCNAT